MLVLPEVEKTRVRTLFPVLCPSRVYLDAYFQNRIPGITYVDHLQTPTIVFVVIEFHHITFVGFSGESRSFSQELDFVLKEEVYLGLVWPRGSGPEHPTANLASKLVRFEFQTYQQATGGSNAPVVWGDEIAIAELSETNFEICESKGECLFAYETRQRFLKECFGLVATSGGEYRGNSEVICQSQDENRRWAGDLQIYVTASARRIGIGARLARELIGKMLARGIRPIWSCNADNEASLRLAQRLGFSEPLEYEILNYETQPGLQQYWCEILSQMGASQDNITEVVLALRSKYRFNRLDAHWLVVTYLRQSEV